MAQTALHQFLIDLSQNVELQEQLRKDPQAALAGKGLSEEEEKLILAGDDLGLKSHLGDLAAIAQIRTSMILKGPG